MNIFKQKSIHENQPFSFLTPIFVKNKLVLLQIVWQEKYKKLKSSNNLVFYTFYVTFIQFGREPINLPWKEYTILF